MTATSGLADNSHLDSGCNVILSGPSFAHRCSLKRINMLLLLMCNLWRQGTANRHEMWVGLGQANSMQKASACRLPSTKRVEAKFGRERRERRKRACRQPRRMHQPQLPRRMLACISWSLNSRHTHTHTQPHKARGLCQAATQFPPCSGKAHFLLHLYILSPSATPTHSVSTSSNRQSIQNSMQRL